MEQITWRDTILATIIPATDRPSQTTFVTPPEKGLQLGFIVYPPGGVIRRHLHRALDRRVVGSSEALIVRQGRCVIEIFSDEMDLVATRDLAVGDVVLLTAGGHGLRMLEDTVLLELKLGPYVGLAEKDYF